MKRLLILSAVALCLGLASPVRAERIIIVVRDFSFTPAEVNGFTSDQYVWTWVQGSHTVTEDSVPPLFDSGLHSPPFRFRRVFGIPGDYFYHCQIHGMAGGIGQAGVLHISTRDFDDDEEDFVPVRPRR